MMLEEVRRQHGTRESVTVHEKLSGGSAQDRSAYLAGLYAEEVEKMLDEVERQHGTREFVGVHARVETDWEQQCAGARNRSDPGAFLFNNKHQCWVHCQPWSSSMMSTVDEWQSDIEKVIGLWLGDSLWESEG